MSLLCDYPKFHHNLCDHIVTLGDKNIALGGRFPSLAWMWCWLSLLQSSSIQTRRRQTFGKKVSHLTAGWAQLRISLFCFLAINCMFSSIKIFGWSASESRPMPSPLIVPGCVWGRETWSRHSGVWCLGRFLFSKRINVYAWQSSEW